MGDAERDTDRRGKGAEDWEESSSSESVDVSSGYDDSSSDCPDDSEKGKYGSTASWQEPARVRKSERLLDLIQVLTATPPARESPCEAVVLRNVALALCGDCTRLKKACLVERSVRVQISNCSGLSVDGRSSQVRVRGTRAVSWPVLPRVSGGSLEVISAHGRVGRCGPCLMMTTLTTPPEDARCPSRRDTSPPPRCPGACLRSALPRRASGPL
jgi:hypothetical protein